jgi:hypothetical protein
MLAQIGSAWAQHDSTVTYECFAHRKTTIETVSAAATVNVQSLGGDTWVAFNSWQNPRSEGYLFYDGENPSAVHVSGTGTGLSCEPDGDESTFLKIMLPPNLF